MKPLKLRRRISPETDSERPPAYAGDADLVRDCLAGDGDAWARLISRYEDLIYSIPRLYGLDPDDSADVFQNVCLALWKGLGDLRSEKALTRWIQVTTRRQSDRTARKRRRIPAAPEDALQQVEDETAESRILENVVRAEEEHFIRAGVRRLPEKCAQLITALYLDDPPMSYDEITERLSLPRGSIGPTRSRCLEKLRKLLE